MELITAANVKTNTTTSSRMPQKRILSGAAAGLVIFAEAAGNVVLHRADTAGKTTNPTRYFARGATGKDEMKKTTRRKQNDLPER